MSTSRIVRLSVLLAAWSAAPVASALAEDAFHVTDGRLTVRAGRLELTFDGPALTGLADRQAGATFSKPPAQPPRAAEGMKLFVLGNQAHLVCPPTGKDRDDPNRPAGQWEYVIHANPAASRVWVSVSWHGRAPAKDNCEILAEGLRPRQVLLGCGASFDRGEPAVQDVCMRTGNGLHSPVFAALEEGRSCVAVWRDQVPETGNIYLAHEPNADALRLVLPKPQSVNASGSAEVGVWQFGAFDRWEQAAAAYRKHIQQATGARPLWDDPVAWTRSIHAVCTTVPNTVEQAEALYSGLAREIDPNRLLLFYWNGSGVIAHGDHRYLSKLQRPTPEVIAVFRKLGFRWMGYHGYVLLISPHTLPGRIADLRAKGWGVPDDYTFQPDWGGEPNAFYRHFRDVAGGYYRPLDEAGLWVLHPGAKKVREFLSRNFADYCKVHDMQGAYLDILGDDSSYHFPPERKVVEGHDFVSGAVLAQKAIQADHPDLAVMSEYENAWILPYVFYAWEGYSHFRLPNSYASIRTRRNHPLRTALWGSFCWTREDDVEPDQSALIGALPNVQPGEAWSVARAKLFCDNELFNDLPDRWDPCALAYWRGSGNRWFQFRRMPWGDAYVELTPTGPAVRLGRFRGRIDSPIAGPTYIPDWSAYKAGRPIGLDPRRTYRFLPGEPNVTAPAAITDLPPGVHVSAVRDQGEFVVIDLGRSDRSVPKGEITLTPARDVVWVGTGTGGEAKELPAGKPAKLAFEGGLVLGFKKPYGSKIATLSWWHHWRGRFHADGRTERDWVVGGGWNSPKIDIDGNQVEVFRMGVGHYRTLVDRWIAVPAEGRSELTMTWRPETVPAGRLFESPVVTVRVNGAERYRAAADAPDRWTQAHVDLTPWAGQAVLLTVSVQAAEPRDIPAGRLHPGIQFRELFAAMPSRVGD